MRGKLSDQDLTDYALNELPPEDRLYLESMFAVSEECRNDIYEMIEMGQLLEEGFELEESPRCRLTEEQRAKLVQFHPRRPIWRHAAAIVSLAAGAAFVATHPSIWRVDDPAGKVAQVSTQMSNIVTAAFTPESMNFATPLANIAAFAEGSAGWLPSASEVLDPMMVCTPPSWMDNSQISEISQ